MKIKNRRHRLYRVYTTSQSGTDLLAIGSNDVECRNGARLSQEFAQNFLLTKSDDGRYLIQKFQAWIVSFIVLPLPTESFMLTRSVGL